MPHTGTLSDRVLAAHEINRHKQVPPPSSLSVWGWDSLKGQAPKQTPTCLTSVPQRSRVKAYLRPLVPRAPTGWPATAVTKHPHPHTFTTADPRGSGQAGQKAKASWGREVEGGRGQREGRGRVGIWQVHHRNPRASPSCPPVPAAPVQAPRPRPSRPTSLTCTGPRKGRGAWLLSSSPRSAFLRAVNAVLEFPTSAPFAPRRSHPSPGLSAVLYLTLYFLPRDRGPVPRPVPHGPFPRAPTWAQKNPLGTLFSPQGRGQKGEGAGPGL